MIEFESKRKFYQRLYSHTTLVILFILLFFVLNGAYKIFQKKQIVQENLNASVSALERERQRKLDLESEVKRLDTKVGQEEILRLNYSLAKEGEKAVFIVDSGKNKENQVVKLGLWQKIVSFFGF